MKPKTSPRTNSPGIALASAILTATCHATEKLKVLAGIEPKKEDLADLI
jgi:hypothetical protein